MTSDGVQLDGSDLLLVVVSLREDHCFKVDGGCAHISRGSSCRA